MYRLCEVPKSCRSKNVISRWFCLSLILLSAFVSRRLRPIDVEFMKRLDKCVNIVPVIAKADTLTIEEREAFRRRVSNATFSERPNEWHLKQTNKKLQQQQLINNSYLTKSVLLVICHLTRRAYRCMTTLPRRYRLSAITNEQRIPAIVSNVTHRHIRFTVRICWPRSQNDFWVHREITEYGG